ncbi:adhesion G protein-coupled receptor E3-like isoform X2 [Erpetoichthys calabaricus]|uniref:adhesion G protein-coupled receptor E3-like isoform X2 n=1 Tax=Erpetoichthys calabaricus TaxID=27687 RepID=UPI00223478B3|nr:adhesion G protein-coupled receptor E3-like isoform X2 [Erpetoichthys calabaricus]
MRRGWKSAKRCVEIHLAAVVTLLVLLPQAVRPTGGGFYKLPNGTSVDHDECSTTDFCSVNALCINTYGSYHCQCQAGYRNHNKKVTFPYSESFCRDINECTEQRGLCGPNATCKNTIGNYSCSCQPGFRSTSGQQTFTANESSCQDIDECTETPEICGPNAKCTNTLGTYNCSCSQGFNSSSGQQTFRANESSCQESPPDGPPQNCSLLYLPIELNQTFIDSSSWFCYISNYTLFVSQRLCDQSTSAPPLKDASAALSSILADQAHWTDMTKEHKSIVAEIYLQTIEELMLSVPENNDSHLWRENTSTENLELEILRIPSKYSAVKDTQELRSRGNMLEVNVQSIMGADREGPVTIGFSSYTGMELILNESFFNSSVSTSSAMKVNSPVVTATVSSRRQHNVTGPVKLTFHHKQLHWSNPVFCVYWKYQKNGSSWSPEGCEVVISNVSHTTCSCSHLTSFALIMAVYEQKIPDDSAFSIFSCVVVSTSLACLALAILTFLFTRSIVDANKTVYLHLSLCLFGAHLLFLIGVEWTSNKTLCSVVAGLLHFLFLASFTWMSLGGLQLLLLVRNLRAVKYSSRQGLRRRHLLPVGYGAPALIVAVAAVVFPRGYGGERHCWLSHQRGFFWSFLGPSWFLIAANLLLFSSVLYNLRSQLHGINSDVSKLKDTRQLTFKSIAHFVIMGCSWAVGLHQELQVLRYLFVLLNGLQGFFIFLVYCLLNRQVRGEYRSCFSRVTRQTETSVPEGTATKDTTL